MATDAQIVKVLKQFPDESVPFYATKLNEEVKDVVTAIYRLEPEADPSLAYKGPKTDAGYGKFITQNSTLRWERLAARTGLGVAEVKRLYTAATGEDPSERYTGRGRRFDGSAPAAKSGGRKAAAGKTTGRGGKANGTSGRRAGRGTAAANAKATASKSKGRRGTRAAASDPK